MIHLSHSNQLHSSQPYTPQVSITTVAKEENTKESSPTDKNHLSTNPTLESENSNNNKQSTELTEQEKKQVEKLKQRDREVRAHEQAHAAAAGSLAQGGPSYEFQTGPDGKRYAVGGSVNIDTSPVEGDPKATLEKAQKIQRAALAPAEPSQQDRAVAAEAAAMAAEARAELAAQNSTPLNESKPETQPNFCAECGGQHSSASHGVSVNIENNYITQNTQKIETVFEIAA